MTKLLLPLLLFICSCRFTSDVPLVANNYTSLTTHQEIKSYIHSIESPFIEVTELTKSSEGRELFLLKISNAKFGEDSSKIKMMIFAQQHGNEQSGKEASLMLIQEFIDGNINELLKNIDILLIPQVNPDGGDLNLRRNANDIDLNRNHLILSESETKALHDVFNEYLPEITLDIHEYYPYTKSWKEFGYLKYWNNQLGGVTNTNIDSSIQRMQKEELLPFVDNYVSSEGYTFNEYVLGGPPNKQRMRFSTVDISDGRQSFGILNTFSMLIEGRRGQDSLSNLKERAMSQLSTTKAVIKFVNNSSSKIKNIVSSSRQKLIFPSEDDSVIIRMEHVRGNAPVKLTLRSVKSRRDSTITVHEFHTKVIPTLKVKKPQGYLVPKSDSLLVEFLHNHEIRYENVNEREHKLIQQYHIGKVNLSVDEELENKFPEVELRTKIVNIDDYYFITTSQLHSNMIVIAFEPQSMYGLVQYGAFNYLLKEDDFYSIHRVK